MKGSLKILILMLALLLSSWNPAFADEMIGKLKKISDQQFLFPAISNDGKNVFYYECRGNRAAGFYQMNLATGKTVMISDNMDTPDWVSWSSTRQQVIITVKYNEHIFKKYGSIFFRIGAKDGQFDSWLYDFPSRKLTLLTLVKNLTGRFAQDEKNWYSKDKIILVERTFEMLKIIVKNIKTGQSEILKCPELEQLRIDALSGNAEGGPGQRPPALDFIWDSSSNSFYINAPNGKIKGLYRLTIK